MSVKVLAGHIWDTAWTEQFVTGSKLKIHIYGSIAFLKSMVICFWAFFFILNWICGTVHNAGSQSNSNL